MRTIKFLAVTILMIVALPPRDSVAQSDFVNELKDRSMTVPGASARLPREAPAPVEPPDLPSHLAAPAPVRLVVEIRSDGGNETERTITRRADAVHVEVPANELEWQFVRNTVDPRYASGKLVSHRERAILYHDQVNLRDRNIARGWADVMTIGIRLDEIALLEPTGASTEAFGLEFEQYVRPGDAVESVSIAETWFNAENGIPLRIVADGDGKTWQQELISLDHDIDEGLFKAPEQRFASYLSKDLADWGEEYHARYHGDH